MPEPRTSDKGGPAMRPARVTLPVRTEARARDSPQANFLSLHSPSRDGRSFERPMRGEGRSVALHALDVPVEHGEVLVFHALALGDALLAGLVRDRAGEDVVGAVLPAGDHLVGGGFHIVG